MAQADVEATLKKAVADDTFRLALARDFDRTIKAHNLQLTAAEAKALKTVDWTARLPTKGGAAAATWVHIYKSSAISARER